METPSDEKRIPKIFIPHRIWEALTLLCEKNDDEWMLFGKTRQEEGNFVVEDLYVPKQKNTKGNTSVEDDGMGEMLEYLVTNGEDPANWNLWIHSHNTMGCFWSGTDHAQMDSFGTDGPDFFLSIVVSSKVKRGPYCDVRAAISLYKPFKITVDELIVLPYEERNETYYTALQTELDAKQTKGYGNWSTYKAGDGDGYKNWNKLKSFDDDDEYSLYHKLGVKDDKEDDKFSTAEEIDILLGDILETSSFKNPDTNQKILDAVKLLSNNYYAVTAMENRFLRIVNAHYNIKGQPIGKKQLKKLLQPGLDANGRTLLYLIRKYNGITTAK